MYNRRFNPLTKWDEPPSTPVGYIESSMAEEIKHQLLVGGCVSAPLKNDGVSSSVGMMTFPI